MIFFFFLVLIAAGAYITWRLLAPEMYVHVDTPHRFFKWRKSQLIPDIEERPISYDVPSVSRLPAAIDVPLAAEEPAISTVEKEARLEHLIADKNRHIKRLQKELAAERSHRTQFEKIQAAMEEEIQRLKTHIKTLKSTKEKTHA